MLNRKELLDGVPNGTGFFEISEGLEPEPCFCFGPDTPQTTDLSPLSDSLLAATFYMWRINNSSANGDHIKDFFWHLYQSGECIVVKAEHGEL